MLNPNDSVVHLTMRYNSTVLAIGTGVLYRKGEDLFLITAWHNVTGRHNTTLKCLDLKYALIPNNIIVGIAQNYPEYYSSRSTFIIPLENDHETFYYVHPEPWPRVDVVAIPIFLDRPYEFERRFSSGEVWANSSHLICNTIDGGTTQLVAVQDFELPNKSLVDTWFKLLAETEELFIPGYPQGITDFLGTPVWKRATVASRVSPGWDGQSKFLIDCASRNGMSGAPVFFYNKEGSIHIGGNKYSMDFAAAIFVGVYVGRIGSVSEFDAQIGVVWHKDVIEEILVQKKPGTHSSAMLATKVEIHAAIHEKLRSAPVDTLKKILNEELSARYGFASGIIKAIGGRENPDDLIMELIEITSQYIKGCDIEN